MEEFYQYIDGEESLSLERHIAFSVECEDSAGGSLNDSSIGRACRGSIY